jgi:hypothetical protein
MNLAEDRDLWIKIAKVYSPGEHLKKIEQEMINNNPVGIKKLLTDGVHDKKLFDMELLPNNKIRRTIKPEKRAILNARSNCLEYFSNRYKQ